MRYKLASAFTLVEVLIVVIVLGILATIVVPQFSGASEDAMNSAIDVNEQVIRSQLELYKLQHGGYPSLANFVDQMTKASKADGSTAASGTSGYPYGPYVLTIPNNPYTNTATVSAGLTGSSAWFYNETTGEFKANHLTSAQATATPSTPAGPIGPQPPPASPFGP